jgi:maltose alpha-D-glucosyltransferase/alpha-amylase
MARTQEQQPFLLTDDPLWYKDAIIYELHVRAYFDSNGDGIGDFRGLSSKLDYLQDLGVTAIWLLPFYPSPLRDDGYDIADYRDINAIYGSLQDFKEFVREAHRRGLHVITELVCNHTSDQHPWFQRARQAPKGSSDRNFYVWSDTPDTYKETRIIFKDFETSNWTWDAVAGAYYWHRFYRHQPDLNFDNPRVQREIFNSMDFWLKMGVDGLRLDAIPYLYEREGTNCENLPETHEFLKKLRQHVDSKFENRMLLAEANQWPEDSVAYFGDGDECHMSFHFPLMPRLFMSLYMEDRFPIIDILEQTPAIHETSQWALFLRNHDELTLEMVTDEERDYMYRIYANDPTARINLGIRRRLAPLLNNNRRRIELMNGLLFSMPGTPVIYYGDEIGMGDNIYQGDRDGVRTPMQWSPDRNAGFSQTNRQRLYLPVITDPEYHYESTNVETQQRNPSSLLWWMKRLIALRKRYKAFGRGTMEFLHPENRKILAFIRSYEQETILVVANMSRFSQCVELDLSAYNGMTPVELFGRVSFASIGDLPYYITLGPHSFFWFSLEMQQDNGYTNVDSTRELPLITHTNGNVWETLFTATHHAKLAAILPAAMQTCRWFGGKARTVKDAQILDVLPMPYNHSKAYILLVRIEYTEGVAETYVVPLAYASLEEQETLQEIWHHAAFARVRTGKGEGILYDALWEPTFCHTLLDVIARRRRVDGVYGFAQATTTSNFAPIRGPVGEKLEPRVVRGEQSNSSVLFGDKLIVKLFRRVDEGTNPDLEIGRFLTEQTGFSQIAPVAGSIEYRRPQAAPISLVIAQQFVPNQGDAWEYTLDVLSSYLEIAAAQHDTKEVIPYLKQSILALAHQTLPSLVGQIIGPYLESSARVLGQRTAEMHLALASGVGNPDFTPEPFIGSYQRSVYQSMRSRTLEILLLLRKNMARIPTDFHDEAQTLLNREKELLKRFQKIISLKITAMRTRCHGDYHLGQVLFTGDDFVIIDFEGEPARSLYERRMKRSPLRDVAGMLRSFAYAISTAMSQQTDKGGIHRPEDIEAVEIWGHFWGKMVSAVFLKEYLTVAKGAVFVPASYEELDVLLNSFLLDKAIYELGYELNNRPDWVKVPLMGVLQLLNSDG